jgi:hypothetical protein
MSIHSPQPGQRQKWSASFSGVQPLLTDEFAATNAGFVSSNSALDQMKAPR